MPGQLFRQTYHVAQVELRKCRETAVGGREGVEAALTYGLGDVVEDVFCELAHAFPCAVRYAVRTRCRLMGFANGF